MSENVELRGDVMGVNFPDYRLTFVKTHKDAILPERGYKDIEKGDACYDLFAVEDTVIPAKGSAVVPVGLSVGNIPPGYYLKIEARSGNGFVKGLEPHPGIIDNGYRGDLGVKLFNLSDEDQTIKKGKGAAQFSIQRMFVAEVAWVDADDATDSTRGEKGFGSSDKEERHEKEN